MVPRNESETVASFSDIHKNHVSAAMLQHGRHNLRNGESCHFFGLHISYYSRPHPPPRFALPLPYQPRLFQVHNIFCSGKTGQFAFSVALSNWTKCLGFRFTILTKKYVVDVLVQPQVYIRLRKFVLFEFHIILHLNQASTTPFCQVDFSKSSF